MRNVIVCQLKIKPGNETQTRESETLSWPIVTGYQKKLSADPEIQKRSGTAKSQFIFRFQCKRHSTKVEVHSKSYFFFLISFGHDKDLADPRFKSRFSQKGKIYICVVPKGRKGQRREGVGWVGRVERERDGIGTHHTEHKTPRKRGLKLLRSPGSAITCAQRTRHRDSGFSRAGR